MAPDPEALCARVLRPGVVCGHAFKTHMAGGTCLGGCHTGTASVCPCLGFVEEAKPS